MAPPVDQPPGSRRSVRSSGWCPVSEARQRRRDLQPATDVEALHKAIEDAELARQIRVRRAGSVVTRRVGYTAWDWVDHGFDAVDAIGWVSTEFDLFDAVAYRDAEVDVQAAGRWRSAGFAAVEAMVDIESGRQVESLPPPKAPAIRRTLRELSFCGRCGMVIDEQGTCLCR